MAVTHMPIMIDCLAGLASARPTAGGSGRIYYATDTAAFSRDTGSAWETIQITTSRIVNGEIPLRAAQLASDDTPAAAILLGGTLTTAVHAAPADGTLAAGDCVIWFDQTDGAGKLMVKAKTANGTVATGSVTLT